jgi:DnaK suppressor protein
MLNKQQLEEFKNLLLEQKEELLSQVNSNKTMISELVSEKTSDEYDYAEISSDSYNLSILNHKQIEEIQEIDLALKKIEDKTYGTCEMCDEPIGIKRLRVKPFARFCIDCRPIYEKSLKQ